MKSPTAYDAIKRMHANTVDYIPMLLEVSEEKYGYYQ